MGVEDTIFRGLASKDCENTTTELLANLLKYKCLRDIFFKCIIAKLAEGEKEISDKIFDKIQPQNIKTQVVFSESGTRNKSIPDIVIENSDCFIIFESKVKKTTKLQSSQNKDYPKLFEDKNQIFQKYIFLLPDNYNREDIDNIKIKDKPCVVITWSKVISAFYESDIAKIAPVVNEALVYLKSVIEISSKELSDSQPLYQIALKYDLEKLQEERKKIEEIETKIYSCKAKIIEQSNKMNTTVTLSPSDDTPKNAYQFGSVIYSNENGKNGSYGIWLGCSPCYFSNDDEKRFKIQLAMRNDVIKTEKLTSDKFYDFHDNWYYFDISEQKDEDKIVEEVFELFKKYHKSFQTTEQA